MQQASALLKIVHFRHKYILYCWNANCAVQSKIISLAFHWIFTASATIWNVHCRSQSGPYFIDFGLMHGRYTPDCQQAKLNSLTQLRSPFEHHTKFHRNVYRTCAYACMCAFMNITHIYWLPISILLWPQKINTWTDTVSILRVHFITYPQEQIQCNVSFH